MLKRFLKLFRSDIFKVISFNSIATLVKMLTNFVSVKIIAVLIGPAGIALLGQLANFSSVLLTASTGGINSGLTKFIAEHRSDTSILKQYISTALKITLFLSAICGLILILLSKYWSQLIFKSNEYQSIFIVFGITIVLYAVNSIFMAIINGFKDFKKYITINIISSITGMIFSVSLAFFFNVYGALLAAVTFQSVVFFVTLLFVLRSPWFKFDFLKSWNNNSLKKLSTYSLMTITSAIMLPVVQFYIRSYIISSSSKIDAGIWEGMNRISSMYLMVITTSLGIYYLPKLSEIKEKYLLKKEIIGAYKIILPIVLLITSLIFIFKSLIISILFTPDFYRMKQLFLPQLVGDFLKISSFMLSFLMVAKAMTKTYIVTEIIFGLLYAFSAVLLFNRFGLVGITLSYCLVYAIYFFVMVKVIYIDYLKKE